MKAITLYQPYASLAVLGSKLWETRGHATHIRETVAIHAAKTAPREYRDMIHRAAFRHELKSLFPEYLDDYSPEMLPCGAVLGTVRITDCQRVVNRVHDYFVNYAELESGEFVSGADLEFGDFSVGRYAWKLEEPREFESPIPARGSQGFWNWEPHEKLEYFSGERPQEIVIRMCRNIFPGLGIIGLLGKPGTMLHYGYCYRAESNKHGAISGICENGERLGVKPGEFEFVIAPEWVLRIWRDKYVSGRL